MRYFRIFFLHFQQAFALRSRSMVWFLISLFNPVLFYIFWAGAYHEKGNIFTSWNLSNVAVYYILLVIAGSLLIVHIEEDVAHWDIQEGGLSRYILKPFPYIWLKFFEELPWRLIQGAFGIITFVVFRILLGDFLSVSLPLSIVILAVCIWIFAYLLSFFYKMILGISALWITDYSGLQQISEVVIVIFAGLLMPLEFLPDTVRQIATALPFSYIIYYPLVALQGKLNIVDMLRVIGIQSLWIIGLHFLFQLLWKKGVKLFTGIGQ